jgi:hypothetical protein
MSFADLRDARRSKLSKSYIDTVKISQISKAESTRCAGDDSTRPEDDVAIASDGLYKHLTDSLEVRSSTTSGRGIWTKDCVASGTL